MKDMRNAHGKLYQIVYHLLIQVDVGFRKLQLHLSSGFQQNLLQNH